MTEEEFLKFLAESLRPHAREIVSGVGDDCAVIDAQDHWLLLTLDTFVEGVHFSWDYFSPYEVGRRLAAANLSDIAAMGGEPSFALLSFSVPSLEEEKAKSFLTGLTDKLTAYGAELVGGDLTKSSAGWHLSLSLLGRTPKGAAIFRRGAEEGDLVFVSRPLGASAAALYLWQKGIEPPAPLKKAHLDPDPEVELGLLLSRHQLASAMIDVSDGLLLDLKRLCEASQKGAKLYLEKIPVAPELLRFSLDDPLTFALGGGEDFALLFTVPEDKVRILEQICPRPLYQIGEIISSPGLYSLESGQLKPLPSQGFDHFKAK